MPILTEGIPQDSPIKPLARISWGMLNPTMADVGFHCHPTLLTEQKIRPNQAAETHRSTRYLSDGLFKNGPTLEVRG